MSDPTAQGEIWTVRTVSGREFTVVTVDSDTLVRERPVIMCARVQPAREVPRSMELLTVPLRGERVISVHEMTTYTRPAFTEREGRVTAEELANLKVALGARFDL